MSPVVNKENKYDWLDKAMVLSESDLINEVREALNKPPMLPKPKEEESVYPFSYEEYYAFVKAHPCLLHPDRPSDPAHFPKTRGAGAPKEWVIPLCRECHRYQEDNQYDFLWLNTERIFEYFYKNMLEAYKILRRVK